MNETVAEFVKYLEKNKYKITKPRLKIAEEVLLNKNHFSIEDVYASMKEKKKKVGRVTIYRTLKLLVCGNFIEKRDFKDKEGYFEIGKRKKHHDHLICINCNRIIEFTCNEIENLQETIAKKHRFKISSHSLKIYGLCQRCIKKDKKVSGEGYV